MSPPTLSLTGETALGKRPGGKAPPTLPTIKPTEATGHPPSLSEAWVNILETHLNKQKPSKQVFIGAGLPVLPKRLVDKMTNGEYINFNELIPFCDPTAEEDSDWETTSERFQLFPELGLIRPGHKLKYTFLQWANCFIIYMAVMASKKHDNVAHMCVYFSTILKASKEFTADWWRLYDFQYRQQAAATHNTDWSVVDTALFSRCFTGHAKRVQNCTNCGSMKHDTQECPRRKSRRPATQESSTPPPKRPKTNLCYNFNYKRPCHSSPCPWKHACLSCQSEDHPLLDCTNRSKKEPEKKP